MHYTRKSQMEELFDTAYKEVRVKGIEASDRAVQLASVAWLSDRIAETFNGNHSKSKRAIVVVEGSKMIAFGTVAGSAIVLIQRLFG